MQVIKNLNLLNNFSAIYNKKIFEFLYALASGKEISDRKFTVD